MDQFILARFLAAYIETDPDGLTKDHPTFKSDPCAYFITPCAAKAKDIKART